MEVNYTTPLLPMLFFLLLLSPSIFNLFSFILFLTTISQWLSYQELSQAIFAHHWLALKLATVVF
jgi:hypothetical protein